MVCDIAELRCPSYLPSYRKSKVPVWSDTLLPEFPDLASAIKRAHQMNHQTSSPKRKRQSAERQSSLKHINNIKVEPNEPKLPRHSFENPRTQNWVGEVEIVESPTMSFRNSSSPAPLSFFNRSDRPSTTVVPPRSPPEIICIDPEIVPHMGDSEPIISVVPQQKMSAMDVDTPTPTQPLPKPVRRMLFKPVFPGRRNQPKIPTPLTPDSAETNLSIVDGHSRRGELEVTSQDVVFLQEKPTSSRSRPPLPPPLNPTPVPPSLPPRHYRDDQKVDVLDTRVSLSKDEDCGNATDTDLDAELVVDLLLLGTPEDSNCLSSPLQQEIIEDLPPHRGHDDKHDKDSEPSVSAVKDTAAVEGLATQFLQQSASLSSFDSLLTYVGFSALSRYLQLFDVDRLKLEAAYAKNALFSCRTHHVQEPSFSMAGLFAPESSRRRQGFNVSREFF